MKYVLVIAVTLASCSPILDFQLDSQINLTGLDFPSEGVRVSVHPPDKEYRQLGILSIESVPRARLVHQVFKSVGDYDETYFTTEDDFPLNLLDDSYWISNPADIQNSLDSLVAVAEAMGGNLIADLEMMQPIYQVNWQPDGDHVIAKKKEQFLPKYDEKTQFIEAVVLRGLVCTCSSLID